MSMQTAGEAEKERIEQLKQELDGRAKKLHDLEALRSQEQQQLGKKLLSSEAKVATQSGKVRVCYTTILPSGIFMPCSA
jgi:hypothetical protein